MPNLGKQQSHVLCRLFLVRIADPDVLSGSVDGLFSVRKRRLVADNSIHHVRELTVRPTLEGIFPQLAVEQNSAAVSRDIADLIRRRS